MRIGKDDFFELTYCTNIHPGNGWEEVFNNLRRYAPALRERLASGEPFGIGLRLSGQESSELLQKEQLQRFRSFLNKHDLYVFTINGFPHGRFHGRPVKAGVHAPDWRDEERVRYTLRLTEILTHLLPDGSDGSISTSPLSYKPWVNVEDTALWKHLTHQVIRVAEELVQIKLQQGKTIHLDIEPEPDGLLENSAEVVRFYEDWLLADGANMLSDRLGVTIDEARACLLDHIRVCFDTCHVAMVYEDPERVLDRFAKVGIRIGKVQISSALRVMLPDNEAERLMLQETLRPFVESTYLHQVTCRHRDGTLYQYPDLVDALPDIQSSQADQWRIHFHVPIFVERYGKLLSTQDDIRRVFALLRQRHFSKHLEIETYTWEVLPKDLKKDLPDLIGLEYEWVRGVFV